MRLRFQGERLPEYQVTRSLRGLQRQGLVDFRRGRWIITDTQEQDDGLVGTSQIMLPHISRVAEEILGPKLVTKVPENNTTTWVEEPVNEETRDEFGPWSTFRKLLRYYRQCIRSEEGADASAYQNQLGERFLYLRRTGLWQPRSGLPWRTTIPLGPHLAPFLGSLPAPGAEEALVLGYPVLGFYVQKDGEPDISGVRPIFFFQVKHRLSGSGLTIQIEDPRPEVNLGWLENAFKGQHERQRSFLSACGFINRRAVEEMGFSLESGDQGPSLEVLTKALESFMPQRVRDPLYMRAIPDTPITEPFETGIYNRAVLMMAKRTRYTKGLLKELRAIEAAPDKVLDRTALAHIFAMGPAAENGVEEEKLHEEVVLDTTILNAEQRHAAASLLTNSVTVITGPPGTGKSQVVSCSAANVRLKGQTLLFTSRNHKAIDAVMGRLTDVEGRPLMVRSNSKEDPNLNVTFDHAIKQLLAEHMDPAPGERLAKVLDEIKDVLKERGKHAHYARQIAQVGSDLGMIENRLAFLGHDLPQEMRAVLDAGPHLFPTKAVQRIVTAAHSLRSLNSNVVKRRLFAWAVAVRIIPHHWAARRRLKSFPRVPMLPRLATPKSLLQLEDELPLLEKAAAFAALRLECLPKEKEARSLPDLAGLTRDIGLLSKRLSEIAPQAVTLDNVRRQGLPPDCDREELDGMRAAIAALRTGLEQNVVEIATMRLLKDRVGVILEGFPCWAVTNLSVASRIPLIPAMFELAIIDEASQSDIPSAIPVLFRAKRVGVVGDPWQLTHSTKLTTARDTLLRREAGLQEVRDLRFAYSENSLYNLVAGTNNVRPILLNDTYRSAESIAEYSNAVFYKGSLRVATNHAALVTPKGLKPGIHWTEVVGEIHSGGGSGCFCQAEVEKVLCILRSMLLDNDFKGSVGVVTPFQQQKRRISDLIYSADSNLYRALEGADFHVDTAHGFQGDERDVIIFSLCGGPDLPRGSAHFLRNSANLFNVAASRARAVLHVVGNRKWSESCGILHVERLARTRERSPGGIQRGPWYPHESPWEKIFYDALRAKGLDPRPQFPVSGRRLDLALIPEGEGSPIDLEVDGDCHRNPDGSRKVDDIWRDLQLQGMGWKVMRFWTYQLREDLQGCVETVLSEWRRYAKSE